MSIDRATGDRTIISGQGVGTGPALNYSTAGIFDGNTGLVTNLATGQILSVDLTTGDRTVFSGAGVGSGPSFHFPADIERDLAGNLLVSDESLPGLYLVNPLTGDRTILSSNSVGNRPDIAVFRSHWRGC